MNWLRFLLAIFVAIAAFTDIRTRRIPNWLTLTGLVTGLATQNLRTAALGAALGFALYFPLFALRARGAGDVKLFTAVGSFLGPHDTFILFILASLLGGVIGLLVILFTGRTRRTLANVGLILNELIHLRLPHKRSPELDVGDARSARLPHGLVIALSVALLTWGQAFLPAAGLLPGVPRADKTSHYRYR